MKNTKLYAVLSALLILLMILSACGATDTPEPSPTVAPTAEPTAEPTAPPAGEEPPDLSMLTDNPWQWMSYIGSDDYFDVESPESYLLAFNADNTVNIVADCNNVSGSYTEDAGSLSIEVGPMTMAACPPESRSDQFVTLLSNAAFAFFEDGYLYIDLLADGGTMSFIWAEAGAAAGELPAELVAQLDAYLQSQLWSEGGDPEGAAPGLVLLADTPEGRYLSAAGVSSLEEMTPMQPDDVLEIGSNTKSMTVVLLMQLQEEGVLSLDDMLGDWLPDLAGQIPNGDQITLRQMAQHTSGLWDYGDPIIGEAATNPDKLEQGYTPEELVQYAIDNGMPDFAPGEEGMWKYSNTGYVLLGMIAEKAGGKSLGELYQERIFDPLGLESAVLIEGVPQEGEITTQGYWWLEDGEVLNTTNWNASQGWAAGAVAMTAEDLATYGKALAAGELFQNEDTLAQMLDFDQDSLYVVGGPYGLGLIDFGNGYWGHEGQTAGFQTLWYTNPDEQITVVGLTNSAAYSGFAFLNVLNILKGEGAKPFTAGTLLPVGNLLSSKWAWVQRLEPSGTSDIAPGTLLTLDKDGTAIAKGEGCGIAIGPFASDASSQISFELDTSLLTCGEEAPVVQLVGLLGSAGTWHFENGNLVIVLDDGSSLLFKADKTP